MNNLTTDEQMTDAVLKKWDDMDISNRLSHRFQHGVKYVVHEFPMPVANIGSELIFTKVVRDVYLKFKSMTGFNVAYTPEWNSYDHRIEQLLTEELNSSEKIAPQKLRKLCRAKAMEMVEKQMLCLRNLGVIGDWKSQELNIESKFTSRVSEAIGCLFREGLLKKEVNPSYWCFECQEVIDRGSLRMGKRKSICGHVKMPVLSGLELLGRRVFVVSYVREMWSFLASSAIVATEKEYRAFLVDGEVYVVSAGFDSRGVFGDAPTRKVTLNEMEDVICDHPVTNRELPLIIQPDSESRGSSGFHTISPAHCEDDYDIASRNLIEIVSIVDDDGKLNELAGPFCNIGLGEVNERIRDYLRDAGYLVDASWCEVSTAICPECRAKMMFKPSVQWFIFSRCVSRRRTWGVPMTIMYCERCGNQIINDDIVKHIKSVINRRGVDSWFRLDPEELMPLDVVCDKCDSDSFQKDEGTVDMVFASAVNHAWKLSSRKDRSSIVDVIIEPENLASKWLLMLELVFKLMYDNDTLSMPIIDEIAPPKMSDRAKRQIERMFREKVNGDIIRLAVFLGEEKARSEYNAVRNVLAEVFKSISFDPEMPDLVTPFDELALRVFGVVVGEVVRCYESRDILKALKKLLVATRDDLSFYMSVSKSKPALKIIVDELLRAWAPIMPFLSEYVWTNLFGTRRRRSVLLELMPFGSSTSPTDVRIWRFLQRMNQQIRDAKSERVIVELPKWIRRERISDYLKQIEESNKNIEVLYR